MKLIAELFLCFSIGFVLGIGFLNELAFLSNKLIGNDTDSEGIQ